MNRRQFVKNKYVRTLIYAVIALVFAGGVYMVIRSTILFPKTYVEPPQITAAPVLTTPQPAGTVSSLPTPEPTPTPKVPLDIPVKIYFSRQKISTDIIPVGIDKNNVMEAPDDPGIGGWLKFSVVPGEPGNSILDGHDSFRGVKGVFSILKKLELGDEVIIEHADGVFSYFKVTDIGTYLKDDVPDDVMSLTKEGDPRLALITCLGDYDFTGYSKSRVVVTCELINNA